MRVALLTNMNNNYFVLMRYLRNFGVDAHLFLTLDEHPHFFPENDTWVPEKWKPFIHKLPIKYYQFDYITKFDRELLLEKLKDFDVIVGSGPSPAYLKLSGLKLDIFAPYKTGIEYFKSLKPKFNFKLRREIVYLEELQKRALRDVKYCINWDLRPITLSRIEKLGMKNKYFGLPMVYCDEEIPVSVSDIVMEKIESIKMFNFVVCSTSRHLWAKSFWTRIKQLGYPFINNNSNQHMIYALDNLVNKKRVKDVCFVFFEYGPHVENSKKLIETLGLTDHVIWLPICPRKEILYTLKFVHIGIGDIAVGAWGGKSIEYLSSGVPCVNSLSDEYSKFESITGVPIPPFIKIDKPDELTKILEYFYFNRAELSRHGAESLNWYRTYEGEKLAKKIADLMEQVSSEKQKLQPIN